MIVREKDGAFVLVKQHDHALVSGEFARHWADEPRPFDSTVYAIEHHDVAWRPLDESARWNGEARRPYSFVDYPAEPKVRAYAAGIDWLEERDPYAACLCSMHYATLVRGSENETEVRFREAELSRQQRLQVAMSAEESENLERNLRLLKLCDGLSLFVCLNEPGRGTRNPPPYPQGISLGGEEYVPEWVDERSLRLSPDPFKGPFEVSVPYRVLSGEGAFVEEGQLELRVVS